MNKEQYRAGITKIVFMMAEAFRDTASDALIDAWVAVLANAKVTIEEAQQAAVQVMSTREYNKLPPPGVFLAILRPPVNCNAVANGQADLVLEQVRRLGGHRQPVFEDPITAKLMEVRWPWRDFCDTLQTSEVKWWRRDFRAAYLDEIEATSPPLLEAPDPKLLGNGKDHLNGTNER